MCDGIVWKSEVVRWVLSIEVLFMMRKLVVSGVELLVLKLFLVGLYFSKW